MRNTGIILIILAVLLLSAGCTTTSSPTSSEPVQAQITYSGHWTGNIAVAGSSQSIEGTGPKTIAIPAGGFASVLVSKPDATGETLTVNLVQGGKILKTGSTSAAYGAVTVSN